MKTLAREADKAEIIRRLRTLRPETARRWGRMSAHQAVCHLSDAFRMALGKKSVSPAGGPLQRTIVKWTALHLPLTWPAGITTTPEIDQARGGTGPGEFAADVRELELLVEDFTARNTGAECPEHPIFGRMSRADWLRWAYLHMDHHLRQFGV
jgi:hypothetical protein